MNRICELLSKAVVRDWASRIAVESSPGIETAEPRVPAAQSSDRERILGYLSLVDEVRSPLICETLGLSKMQVYRALQPLIASGRVVARGHFRTTIYTLNRTEADRAALN